MCSRKGRAGVEGVKSSVVNKSSASCCLVLFHSNLSIASLRQHRMAQKHPPPRSSRSATCKLAEKSNKIICIHPNWCGAQPDQEVAAPKRIRICFFSHPEGSLHPLSASTLLPENQKARFWGFGGGSFEECVPGLVWT